MAQLITSQHIYIDTHTYIYIYIYAVELKLVQDLGVFVLNWPKTCVKNWSQFFSLCFSIFIVFWGMFKHSVNFAKKVFSLNCRDVKNEVFERKLHFCYCLFMLLQEKRKKERNKMEKPKKNYNNSVF